jgi:hypothetical protein
MIEPEHFAHMDNNVTYIGREDWPAVDELVDWLIEKNRSGYKMVNSVQRLNEMREFMRGKLQEWNCRAGHNNVIIRVDGTLAPCFPDVLGDLRLGRRGPTQLRDETARTR